MNLEESTPEKVPQSLQAAVDKITQNEVQETLQRDLLFALILVLLYENGFVLLEQNSTDKPLPLAMHIENLKATWKTSHDLYECYVVLLGFSSVPVQVLMSPIGSVATVNAVIEKFNHETYSVCLPISRYVPLPRASKASMIFRDLNFFSLSFKNKIITPLKCKILTHHGFPSASMTGLPEEVILKICMYLPIKDILHLSEVCTLLYNTINSEIIWHEMFKRDYAHTKVSDSWKDEYKAKYITHKNTERISQRSARSGFGTLHDFMEYSDLVSYVDNPFWDVI